MIWLCFRNDNLAAASHVFIVIILFYKYEYVMGINGQTLMQINSKKLETENVTIEEILKAISDNKALVLFNTIALAEGSQIQIRKMGLTTRQYYSRLSKLIEAGLVTRKNGRYLLTLLGKIVYEAHMTVCKALSYHWKLKAIEFIQMSTPAGVKLPEEEFSKVIDTLIDDHKIKNMVTRELIPMEDREKYFNQQREQQEINVLVKQRYH